MGDSFNDKLGSAYTPDATQPPFGAVRVIGTISTTGQGSTTGTVTSVSDSSTTVQMLAANTSRLGVSIVNDSSAKLYVKTGLQASTADYTVQIVTGGYWECNPNYTGIITGTWDTDPNDGAARVTEYT